MLQQNFLRIVYALLSIFVRLLVAMTFNLTHMIECMYWWLICFIDPWYSDSHTMNRAQFKFEFQKCAAVL